MRFRQRTSKDGEILGKYIDESAINCSIARYHPVAQIVFFVETEILAPMHNELAHLLK